MNRRILVLVVVVQLISNLAITADAVDCNRYIQYTKSSINDDFYKKIKLH